MRALRVAFLGVFILAVLGVGAFSLWNLQGGSLGSLRAQIGLSGEPSGTRASGGPPPPTDPSQAHVQAAGLDELARKFYERRQDRPAWFAADGRPNASARTMMDAVRRAADEGLDTADYDVTPFERSFAPAMAAPSSSSPGSLAALDARMTTVFLRYASDVSTGRVDPRSVHADWHLPPNTLDVARMLDDAVDQNHMAEALAALPPPHPEYARLKQALAALRAEAQPGPGGTVAPTGDRTSAAMTEPEVMNAALRSAHPVHARSAASGPGRRPSRYAKAPKAAPPAPPPLPVAERMRRVTLSMERWRWVPRQLGDPGIFINLPAFRLDVLENDRSVLAMKIVAGKSFSPTPVFSDSISSLVFHPTWNIPDGIARDEILPAVLHDPGYLQKKGIRALNNFGENAREVDPAALHEPKPGASLPYVFRQDPGPENPLGRIKFLMPNKYDIYLHDTPAGQLFAKDQRAFSHGCIRVEKPAELAEYLLQGTEWDKVRIESALDEKDTQEVRLARPMPVIILYMTAWVDEPDGVHYGEDIYGLDPELEAMLSKSREERAAAARAAQASGDSTRDETAPGNPTRGSR